FREDLYYRLNVVPITSPPLRERAEDILVLTKTYLEEYCTANELPLKTLSVEVVERLQRYPWPGNVRELRNQVERMVIMCPATEVRVEDCSSEIRAGLPPVALSRRGERVEDVERRAWDLPPVDSASASALASVATARKTLQEARKEFERNMIFDALERNEWNVSRAADALGLERTNLHKKINQFGLRRK
ncbi:MAG: sigma-54-dependent Fis family transcriptional regulator, partial [Candidatus Krumholzibacteria bacterium]|nr:sigma-54-dependent Fis family transcriptional regulator [Candidatus Krumholzibacteria bacterium]